MTALNPCVLIADYEPSVATLIQRVVDQMGYTAVILADGAELVAAAQFLDTSVACIICDVLLPLVSGTDAAVTIRTYNSDVPIIFTCGPDYGALPDDASLLPNTRMVVKPFMLETIRSILIQVLPPKEREV